MKSEFIGGNDFNFKVFLDKLLSHWMLIILSIIVFICLSIAYIIFTEEEYKIQGKLLVQDQQVNTGSPSFSANSPSSDISTMFNFKNNANNEIQVLTSRKLVREVVQNLGLYTHVYKDGAFKKERLFETNPFKVVIDKKNNTFKSRDYSLEVLDNNTFRLINEEEAINRKAKFGELISTSQYAIKVEKRPNIAISSKEYEVKVLSEELAVSDILDRYEATFPDKEGTMIGLSLDYPDPNTGIEILNNLVKYYLIDDVQDKIKIADSTLQFIDKRIALISGELEGVERNLEQYRSENSILDLGEQSRALVGNSSDFTKRVQEQEIQLSILKDIERYVNDPSNNQTIPSSLSIDNASFGTSLNRYNELLNERQKQSLVYTATNPILINLDKQIQESRNSLKQSIQSYRKEVQLGLNQLKSQNNNLNSEIKDIPGKERKFLDFSRQQNLKQQLYFYLLQKKEEAAIFKTSKIVNSRIVDFPTASLKPFKPNKPVILGLGFLTGLLLPIFFIYTKQLINNKIGSKDDVLQLTKAPIIGEIVHNPGNNPVVLETDNRTFIAEQFRTLRTNINFHLNGISERNKVLLITSSMSGEGKTFVAINLAIALALTGKRVLLIDFDIRKSDLSKNFNISEHVPGVSNFLNSNTSKLVDIVTPVDGHDNLFLLSSGLRTDNPSETLMKPRLNNLLNEAKDNFDYIILDTPPIGQVADAQLVASYADLTLYVVRHYYTLKEHLNIVEEIFQKNKMEDINILVNDINTKKGYGFSQTYGYDTYSYGYKGSSKRKALN